MQAVFNTTSRGFGQFFEQWDIILTPITALPTPKVGTMEYLTISDNPDVLDWFGNLWRNFAFTPLANLCGIPAISLPLATHEHGLPLGIQAIAKQANELCYVTPGYATEARARLSEKLLEVLPAGLNKFFFATSGTEANEAAFKIARMVTGKNKIISRYRSYHGATAGAIVQRCLGLASPGAIFVMHVGSESADGDALPRVIAGLRAAGYGFATIDELIR